MRNLRSPTPEHTPIYFDSPRVRNGRYARRGANLQFLAFELPPIFQYREHDNAASPPLSDARDAERHGLELTSLRVFEELLCGYHLHFFPRNRLLVRRPVEYASPKQIIKRHFRLDVVPVSVSSDSVWSDHSQEH